MTILSATIESETPAHTTIAVFNRGGRSGTLVVLKKDAEAILERLTYAEPEEEILLRLSP